MLEAVARLRTFFEPRGTSLVTAAVAWVLAQPGITSAILGASKPEQLDASLAAVNLITSVVASRVTRFSWRNLLRKLPWRRRYAGSRIRGIAGPRLVLSLTVPLALATLQLEGDGETG